MIIRAASADSAAEMQAALAAFKPRLVEAAGKHTVVIHLGNDAQIVGVLTALQDYVRERADGPARIDFEGRRYTFHPEPSHPGGL